MAVSIIIPVHNQWELLEKCVKTILEKSNTKDFQIVLINDGSDLETSNFCQLLFDSKIVQKYIKNPVSKGFTESCNQGILESKNFEYVCLLNSDTQIVTQNWLEKITTYWASHKQIGCMGVLSNCATTQSVGKSCVNDTEIDTYGNWVTSLSERRYPETAFVNGFCFFISYNIIKVIGLLDTRVFPHYGSEDDYVLKIRQRGYKLAIADDVYVYHRSNQSYKGKRDVLVKYSYPTLLKKWGQRLIQQNGVIAAKALDYLRSKILSLEYNEAQVTYDCDIVLITHNALPYLQKCVESIIRNTANYRLIIVDNCSDNATKMYLMSLKNIEIIYNSKNFGFGYANNQALRKSNSKYVCFLNSDTVVTSNWLLRLINLLEENNAGIIGPVTNYTSSEIQKVGQNYNFKAEVNDNEIRLFSQKQYANFGDDVVEANKLIGFCFVTKRELLNQVGFFDDRFIFNFEDDDLCNRFIENGYKLICSKGVFIYHFGSKSFQEKEGFFEETLEQSKKLYLQKWYDSSRIQKINEKKDKFSIIYILASNQPSGGVKVVFEYANRLKSRGYDVSIWCYSNTSKPWFDLDVSVSCFKEYTEIPEVDIAIGTYFSTLDILQKIKAKIKIHFCQGYEALIYDKDLDATIVDAVNNNYLKIKEKIVISKYLKSIIDKKFETESHYIPNGIDQYVFSLRKHERNKLPRILIVGNYNLVFKGVKIALEGATNYLKISKCAIVRLASEKCSKDEPYEFYNMSNMTQIEIANVYASCDVVVNAPFEVEGFSLPPLEAMASGTPVITTDCGGVNDYAVHGQNALIVPPKNSGAICSSLKLLFLNETIYSRLIEEGLKTANEFLWYKSIDKLETVLHRLYSNYLCQGKEQLSVCMIVKNEQDCLGRCLESIKNVANEIIIVDTGSTDNTIKIAKQYGAKIYHFAWIDDFSAARNFSLEKATQPWTLVLDADEMISEKDIDELRKNLQASSKAYGFITRNYVNSKNVEGINTNTGEYEQEEKGYIGWCRSDKIRLFPTNKNIKFRGEIHELVEKSIEELGIDIEMSAIPIHHYSKLNSSKNETYLKLSKKKAETFNDTKALFELGTQYLVLNNPDEALVTWRRLLELEPENEDVLAHLGTTYNLIEDYEQAEKYFLESIKIKETEYAVKHLGICYAKQNRIEDAYFAFRKIVYKTDDLKTMADFSHCCNVLKKNDEAISILEKCLRINTEETKSWGLLEVAYNDKGIDLANKNSFQKAIFMFKSALSVNPNFDIAKSNLSIVNKLLETRQFSKKFIK
ncbi:MAG: glycosyltransferase [Candidatus Nanoarchaeia archaeon]|jgi:GT2 family glycosyltransferase/Tfp pilus assembly protein PilF|nr:glycosyltransferase [Candidatus Nanoarchaeia archaeon]